jgi:hypothetical protein
MAIKGSAGNSAKFEKKIIPSGNYIARCYGIIELGTITEKNAMGELKTQRKIMIDWEFPTEKVVFSEEKGEQPFVISKEFTISMNEKANLRKTIESWRGRVMTDKEANDFDITKLLGQPCMINVVHKAKKDGSGSYAVLSGVTPVPKGFECPTQINPTRLLEYDNWNQELYMSLPNWLAERISSSKEYNEKFNMNIVHSINPQEEENPLPF